MPGKLNKSVITLSLLMMAVTLMSGCSEKVVYNRSVAELNQKAQAMLQQGDAEGAVSRLESASDLYPDEPNTLHNLAIAYQAKGDLDKSIQTFEHLLTLKDLKDVGKIQKSLGVVYEEKADALYAKSEEALEQKKPEDAQKLKDESIGCYEKAINAYAEAKKTPGTTDQPDDQLDVQTEALQRKIEEMRAPAG